MKYILNSKCKNFAGMRKQIVKSLMALMAAMTCLSSYAELTFPKEVEKLTYNGKAQALFTDGTADDGYTWVYSPFKSGTPTPYSSYENASMNAINADVYNNYYILNAESGRATISGVTDGYTYVDLGLSDGTLWSTCNLGATSIEGIGLYYKWGETTGSTSDISDGTHKYEDENGKYTKYVYDIETETSDYNYLQPEDDAATVNWGKSWSMPTQSQFNALIAGCTWENVKDYNSTGVSGFLGTSKSNGNTIFFAREAMSEMNLWSSNFYAKCGPGAVCNTGERWLFQADYISGKMNSSSNGTSRHFLCIVRPVTMKKGTPTSGKLTTTIDKQRVGVRWSQYESNYKFTYDGDPHISKCSQYQYDFVKGDDVKIATYLVDDKESILPGTYTAKAVLEGEDADNYYISESLLTREFYIEKLQPTLDGSPKLLSKNSIEYDGEQHVPFVAPTLGSATATPGHWEYCTLETSGGFVGYPSVSQFSTTLPKVTNVGSYRTYFIYVPDDDVIYEPNTWSKNSLSFEIKPKEIELIWSPTSKYFEYDGKAKVPTAKFKEGDIVSDDKVNVVVSVSTEAIEPKKEGSYIATATLTGVSKDNYKISSDFETFDFNILQGNIPYDYVFPEIKKDLVYNGKDQDLLIAGTAGSVDGTWMYSSDGGVTFSKEIPTGKNADIYKNITFKFVPKDNNYSEAICSYYSAEIKPKEITFTTHSYVAEDVNKTSFVYNGELQKPELKAISGKVSGDNVNVIFDGNGEINVGDNYSVSAKLTGSDADNYILSTDVVPFRITRKELTVVWTKTDLIYSGQPLFPEYTLSGLIGEDKVVLDSIGAESKIGGPYTATLKLNKAVKNYKLGENSSVSTEFTISSNTTTIDLKLTRKGWTYGEAATANVLTGNDCDAEVTYTYYTDASFTKLTTTANGASGEGKEPTYAGTYYVKAVVKATDKCEAGTATASFTIAKKNIAVSWDRATFVYDGKQHLPKPTLPTGLEEDLKVSSVGKSSGPLYGYAAQKWYAEAILSGSTASCYSIVNSLFEYVVTPKEITLVWGKTDLTYNGVAQTPTVDFVAGDIYTNLDNVTISVSGGKTEIGNGYVATASLAGTGAGNYVISKDYVTKEFNIIPNTTPLTLTLKRDDWVYGDPSSEIQLSGNKCDGTVTYTYYTDSELTKKTTLENGASVTGGVPSKAGKYYFKAEVAASGTCLLASATSSFTIEKKSITVSWSDLELPYNGNSQGPVPTLKYVLTGDVVTTTVLGKMTDVTPEGEVYVASVVLGGRDSDNYVISGSDKAKYVIVKASASDYKDPVGFDTLVYIGSAQKLVTKGSSGEIPGVFKFVVDGGTEFSEDIPTMTNAGEYKVGYIFAPNDFNYTPSEPKYITVKIAPVERELKWGNTTLKYNGNEQSPTATLLNLIGDDVVTVEVSGAETKVGDGYVANATLTGIDAKNYLISSKSSATAKFSIVESDYSDFKAPVFKDLVYNGSDQELVNVAGKQGTITGTFLYSVDKGDLTADIPSKKVPNTYAVGYQFVPNDKGYLPSEVTYTNVKISPKELTLDWGTTEFVYDETPKAPSPILGGVEPGDVVTVTVTGEKTEVGSNYEAIAKLGGKDVDNYTISSAKLTTEFSIVSNSVNKPAITQREFTYDGTTFVFVPESKNYKVVGFGSAKEPGTYPVNIVLNPGYTWSDGSTTTIEESFVIKKKIVEIPTRDLRTFTFNGTVQTYELMSNSAYKISGNQQRKAGSHVVTASLIDKAHYEWSDNTTADKEYTFTIATGIVKSPVLDSVLTYYYDGVEKEFGITSFEGSILNDSNSVGTDAGVYIRTVTLDMDEDGGYVWSDNTSEPKVFKFEIKPQPVIIPSNYETYFIYNGKPHTFVIPEDTAKVKRYSIVMEESSSVGPGTFLANLVLKNKTNYIWADGKVDDREVTFTISDGKIAKPEIQKIHPYTGEEIVFVSSTSAYTVEGGSGINAGSYTVVVTPKENYSWLDGSKDPMEEIVRIVEKKIDKPVIGQSPVTYNGEELFRIPVSEFYKISGDTFGVEPGKYKTVLSLMDKNYMWSDSTQADLVYNFEISKIKIPIPVSDKTVFTYDGTEKTYKIDADPVCVVTGNKHTDAGLYSVKVSIESPYHQWDDNTEEPKSYRFLISSYKVAEPIVPQKSFVYDGTEKNLEILPSDDYVIDDDNATATNVGEYKRKVSLIDNLNYVWSDGSNADKVIDFEIKPQPVNVPVVKLEHPYTGSPIEFVEENPAYSVTNRVQTNSGEYEVVISLNPNYIWKDNSTDDKVFVVEIGSMSVSKPDVDELTFEYDGTTHSFGFTPSKGYSFVGDTAAKEPGVYVVTVKLNKNYIWDDDTKDDINFTFVISKIDVNIPVANTTKFAYNGKEQTYDLIIPEDSLFTVNNNVYTEAGSYVVNVSLKDPDHYQWSDSTIADKLYDFVINKGKVPLPTAPTINLIYDGKPKDLIVNPSDLYVVADSNAVATKTGKYIRTATLVDPVNYTWIDETTEVKSIVFVIGDGSLDKPDIKTEYTYTGDTIIFVPKDGAYSVINGAKREVGKYKVVVIPNEGYRWSDNSVDPLVVEVVIKPIIIEIPMLQLEYTYNGKIIDFKVPVNAAYKISGETSAKEIGKYKVTLDLIPNYMWNDSTLEDVSYVFSINKRVIPIPPVDSTFFVYNGKRQTYSIAKSPDYNVLGNVQAYAGSYEVSVLLTDFVHTIWSDSTIEVKTYNFNIARAKVDLPTAVQESFAFDGTVKYFAVTENSRYEVLSKNSSASEVGVYDRIVTLKDTLNYTWIDGSVQDKVVTFTIGTGVVDYPTVVLDTIYTGSPITFVPDHNAYTVENGTKTEAGTYEVVVKLKEGYLWSDKSSKDTVYTVVIRPISIVKPTFPTTDTYTYNDSVRGVEIPESDGYTVSGITQTKEPGKYVVTVDLNPNYIWSDNTTDQLTYIYTINKIVVEIPAKCDSVFKFTGSEITYPIPDTLDYYIVTGHHRTSSGLHTVTVTLTDTIHYVWSDNTTDPKYYEFLIDKYKIEIPLAKVDSFTYDGGVKLFEILPNDNYIVERNNASAIDTGIYYRNVSLIDTVNFLWSDGTIEDKKVAFYILNGVIPSINIATDLVYTGDTLVLIEERPAVYTVTFNKVVNAGTYEVIVTPNPGYTWASDSSKTGKRFTVNVAPKMVPVPVPNSGTFLYNGKLQTYNIMIPEDSVFTVSGNVQSEVGTYIVEAALKDTRNYCWADTTIEPKTYEFKIENSIFDVDPIHQSNDLVLEATPGHYAVFDVNIFGSAYKYWITCDSFPELNVDTTLIDSESLSSIDLYLPDTLKPGIYKLNISFMSGTLVKSQEVDLKVNYPAANIYLVWNDVLTIDNSDNLFETYQWYKNGQPIEGATNQYYQENDGLDGYYQCLVNNELFVGPLFFYIDKPLWIKAYGGKSIINVEVIGDIPTGTKVGVYSVSGYEVDVKDAERFVTFESVPNTYVVKLIGPDPTVKFTSQAVKVLVK